jgi:hypothetical protein
MDPKHETRKHLLKSYRQQLRELESQRELLGYPSADDSDKEIRKLNALIEKLKESESDESKPQVNDNESESDESKPQVNIGRDQVGRDKIRGDVITSGSQSSNIVLGTNYGQSVGVNYGGMTQHNQRIENQSPNQGAQGSFQGPVNFNQQHATGSNIAQARGDSSASVNTGGQSAPPPRLSDTQLVQIIAEKFTDSLWDDLLFELGDLEITETDAISRARALVRQYRSQRQRGVLIEGLLSVGSEALGTPEQQQQWNQWARTQDKA